MTFSISDNEGAAEMLIDTLSPAIVNSTDSKNRYTSYSVYSVFYQLRAYIYIYIYIYNLLYELKQFNFCTVISMVDKSSALLLSKTKTFKKHFS